MICPRCGVTNPADRSTCSRCSGSLAPPPGRGDTPLPPVLAMTRRAELEAGHARRAAVGPAASTRATGPLGPEATGTAGVANPAELYLLAADRPTGQPPPPEAGTGSPGPARPTERPGRMAVGLSGA